MSFARIDTMRIPALGADECVQHRGGMEGQKAAQAIFATRVKQSG
jgi:hypothetical protein